jgi:hypothetical protein
MDDIIAFKGEIHRSILLSEIAYISEPYPVNMAETYFKFSIGLKSGQVLESNTYDEDGEMLNREKATKYRHQLYVVWYHFVKGEEV